MYVQSVPRFPSAILTLLTLDVFVGLARVLYCCYFYVADDRRTAILIFSLDVICIQNTIS